MDSMRSLNTSLPRASSATAAKPSSEVLQAFKSAALSITQLYKSASADADAARAAGYQECLDELLTFLDAENMGLGDGEGWRVRQWATERLSGGVGYGNEGDAMDEEEKAGGNGSSSNSNSNHHGRKEGSPAEDGVSAEMDASRGAGHSSQRRQHPPSSSLSSSSSSTSPEQEQSQQQQRSKEEQQERQPPPDVFHFRAHHGTSTYSSEDSSSPQEGPARDAPIFGSHNQIHLQVLPPTSRAGRLSSSLSSSSSRQGSGSSKDRAAAAAGPSISLGSLGHGAGSKRKHNLAEFFDLGDLLLPKDGFGGSGTGSGGNDGRGGGGGGGGKKGRFV